MMAEYLQNIKLVQNCTGFIFYTFIAVVHHKLFFGFGKYLHVL